MRNPGSSLSPSEQTIPPRSAMLSSTVFCRNNAPVPLKLFNESLQLIAAASFAAHGGTTNRGASAHR
jgi:hypothetical protein